MRQPEHIQALQEVGCCCLGGDLESVALPFCACSAELFGIQSYTCDVFACCGHSTWAAGSAARSWLELLSVTGKGWRGKRRLLCSPSGCFEWK